MLEFDKERFAELLLTAPAKEPLLESAEPNAYVQSLIDTFENEGRLDLTTVDLDAFELKHVTPKGYESSLTPIKVDMPLDIPLDIPQGTGQIVPKPMAW